MTQANGEYMTRGFLARVFMLICILMLPVSYGCTGESTTPKKAPDFALEDLSGNRVTLQQYSGQVVLMDFWATWCPPCRESIPELIELQAKYGPQGLVVLGMSLDDHTQFNNGNMKKFKEEFRINYTIVKADVDVALAYFGDEKMAVPTAFVINRDGEIVHRQTGFRPGAVEKSLKKLF